MARISEIRVGYSRTKNLGHFESLRIEASVTVEVNPEDGTDSCRMVAQTLLRQLIEDTYEAQYVRQRERKIANE